MPTQLEETAAVILLDAIAQGDVQRVASTLALGANPNIAVEPGVYPLNAATFLGRLDMVQLLLCRGAEVDSRDLEGHASLHMACIKGHTTILQELLSAGANPDMTDVKGRKPLHFLAREGSIEALRVLIQAGAQLDARDTIGYAPIHHAADRGNVPALRELVRAGSSHAWRGNTMETPLAAACLTGQSESVEYLLDECKADPDAADDLGHTPLAIAAENGHLAVVKLMLGRGVSRLGPRAYRDTLLSMAMCGNVSMLRELIGAEGGVHVNKVRNLVNMTPLHFSAGFSHVVATHMLLEAGGNENDADLKGQTPLGIVDAMRKEHVSHGWQSEHVLDGLRRQRVMQMLSQGPAYRARSWRWPNELAPSARSSAAPAKTSPESTKIAAEPTTATAEARLAKGATEPTEMTAEDFDRAFVDAMATATASATMGKVNVKVYRRPAISSSGSAADGHSAVVASMIRYSQKK